MTEQTFALPNLSPLAAGVHHGPNYQLTIQGEFVYTWAIQPQVAPEREFTFLIWWVPGTLPVTACATLWSTSTGQPAIGATKVYVRSIERGEHVVRVTVEHQAEVPVDIAVGIGFPKRWSAYLQK